MRVLAAEFKVVEVRVQNLGLGFRAQAIRLEMAGNQKAGGIDPLELCHNRY